MGVAVAADTIVCPRCGSSRIVTHRQRRRSVSGGGILCSVCRGIGVTRRYQEKDLHYWLRRYGAECPRGTPVRQFIAAGGAPAELVDLARTVFPTVHT